MLYGKWSDGSISCRISHNIDYKYVRRWKNAHTGAWEVSFCSSETSAKKVRGIYLPGRINTPERLESKRTYEYTEVTHISDKADIKQILENYPILRSGLAVPQYKYGPFAGQEARK